MREPAFWHRSPSLTSLLLAPLGALYGMAASRRMQREGFDAGIPVLCVGNYHVGGAGKTPTVLALTKLLRDLGETPVVLSRGYGGRLRGPIRVDPERHDAADVGDEPLMMARTVPVAVARDRVDGVALARSQGASVILMDDGFQNPAISKDASLASLRGRRALAFAGIGDPGRFFNTLRAAGIEVARERAFSDHHPFTAGEIQALIDDARRDGLTLVTTEKDLARLRKAGTLPSWAQEIVPFAVTLEFDSAVKLRRFVSERLYRAREKKFSGRG